MPSRAVIGRGDAEQVAEHRNRQRPSVPVEQFDNRLTGRGHPLEQVRGELFGRRPQPGHAAWRERLLHQAA
jgi:hypothetical protein